MLINILLLALVTVAGYFVWHFSTQCIRLRIRYGAIIDVEQAAAEAKSKLEEARREHQEREVQAEDQRQKMDQDRQIIVAEQRVRQKRN